MKEVYRGYVITGRAPNYVIRTRDNRLAGEGVTLKEARYIIDLMIEAEENRARELKRVSY